MTTYATEPIQYTDIDLKTVYRLIAETEAEDAKRGDDEFWTGWRCALIDLRQRMGRATTDKNIAQLADAGIICATCTGPLHHTGRCLNCERNAALPEAYTVSFGRPDDDGNPVQTDREKAVYALYRRLELQVERDATIPANGCRACGVIEREHGNRYNALHTADVGRSYLEPTDRQRLDRIHARLAAAVFSPWTEVNRRFARDLAEGNF